MKLGVLDHWRILYSFDQCLAIDKFYLWRKKGGRGFVRIENCVDVSIKEAEDYMKKRKEKLITVANKNIRDITTNRNMYIETETEKKTLHGYFK